MTRSEPIPGMKRSLDAIEIESRLPTTALWQLDRSATHPALQRVVVFATEAQATAFLRALEILSNRLDHHPQIHIQGAVCTVRWWTHEPPGLSQLDFECARHTDRLLQPEPS